MNLKQKIEATILLLFSVVPLNFILGSLKDLSAYIETYPEYLELPQSPETLYSIGKFIFQNEKLLSLFLVVFIVLFLLIIWSSAPLFQKILRGTQKLFSVLYFLLFGYIMVLFIKATVFEFFKLQRLEGIDSNIINSSTLTMISALIFFLFSYIETIWKFSKKSLSRKYFNGLYLVFSSIHWYRYYDSSGRISEDWGGFVFISYALFFYFISLTIAAAEFTRRSKSMPESNSVLPKQAMEQ